MPRVLPVHPDPRLVHHGRAMEKDALVFTSLSGGHITIKLIPRDAPIGMPLLVLIPLRIPARRLFQRLPLRSIRRLVLPALIAPIVERIGPEAGFFGQDGD